MKKFSTAFQKEIEMCDAPKTIWLQRPNRDPENEWCGETTWCEDKQNDDDTCYIKAGIATTQVANIIDQLRAKVAELEPDAMKWREREKKIADLKSRGFLKNPLR